MKVRLLSYRTEEKGDPAFLVREKLNVRFSTFR